MTPAMMVLGPPHKQLSEDTPKPCKVEAQDPVKPATDTDFRTPSVTEQSLSDGFLSFLYWNIIALQAVLVSAVKQSEFTVCIRTPPPTSIPTFSVNAGLRARLPPTRLPTSCLLYTRQRTRVTTALSPSLSPFPASAPLFLPCR